MFSEKATKIDKIFTVNLTVWSNCQIDGEDFVIFCGLLKKHELYKTKKAFSLKDKTSKGQNVKYHTVLEWHLSRLKVSKF